jgi:hypothetical protein
MHVCMNMTYVCMYVCCIHVWGGDVGGFVIQTNENISPSVLNRLIKEVKEYTKNPVSDIVLQVNEANVTDIRADLHGPAETPYQAGVFRMKLVFGPDFPAGGNSQKSASPVKRLN